MDHGDLMLAAKAAKPFDRPGWIFQLKYDGFPVLAVRDGPSARLLTRRGNDIAPSFPDVMVGLSALPDMVADRELVVLDEIGRPQFDRLQRRARMKRPNSIMAAGTV